MLSKVRQTSPKSRSWKKRAFAASLIGLLSTSAAMAQQRPDLPPLPAMQLQSPVQPGAVQLASKSSDARLQVYNVPSDQIGNVGSQLQLQYHTNASVKITTEPRTGQLMVMAPEAIQNQIAGQVATFMRDNKIPVGDRGNNLVTNTQQKYALQNLSWRELEDSIQRLAGPRVTVTTERNGELANLRMTNPTGLTDILQIDRRQNSVTMLGTNATVAGWAQVVFSLDKGQADSRNLTHIVPLAPAEPRQVQRAIQLVKAAVQQDQANAQVEAQVDVGDQPATAIGTIDQLTSESGLFGDVQIEFIEELDLVIIRGNKRDVQRTLEVIEKIKLQAIETQPEVDVFPLQHANGQAVATLVTELYENIYAPRQGPVSITALGQPNALLLIGSKEVVKSVKELVAKIDQPLDRDNQLKVIRLLHASSVDVETRVREFFVEEPPGGDQREGIGTRVKVLADYRTNSLIVQASPREMIELQLLIEQLDVEGTTAENEVRVFRLQNTLSDDLQTVINEVITGQGAGGDTAQASPPSGKLSMMTIDGTNTKIASGILAGVIITSDPSVNALVVRAPSQSMALIEQLIKQLDSLPSAEARIKVFQLVNGDATSLAQTLQSLFGLPVTAGQTAGNNFLTNLTQSTLTAGGEGALVQLQIAADARTNSIIVSGASSDLEVFETLLLRLDEDVVESRRMEVIWLRNANADEVAAALTTYFQQQATANQSLANGVSQILSASQLVARQVFVVAEVTTNSILLSASPAYFDTAVKLIERLDRRPPMVAIQVLIAEVQLDDSLEFGAEWGIQDGLLFDRRSASGGTLSSPVFNLGTAITGPSGGPGQTQNVAGHALTNFALGRSNSDSIGGLVLSASSEAVGVLIRALQTANRIQVLSRPQITTLDQRPASTLVGQQVPRINGVTQSANIGQTVNAVDTSVGLGLSVLPRVNQDGLIVMQVQVLNSSVGDTDTGIPIGFGVDGQVIRSPIINTTEASTTVSAYSGQTVVFAGLISKTRASVRRQIPILGSLPLIGAAFRFDTETEQRRELMVVLTPRIIQTDEDYDVFKQVESSRMSWCLADVLNVHGEVGLSGGNGLWGPAKSAVIFPDQQPSVLEDTSVPNSHRPATGFLPMEEPTIIDSYPLGQRSGADGKPVIAPAADSSAAARTGNSPFRTVGYSQSQSVAVPNQPAQGAQQGAYK